MANVYLNNIYGNAAFQGALEGFLSGRDLSDAVAADYLAITNTAAAVAKQVDSKIVFDALVSTAAAITQLAITTNVIAANEQHRAGLLRAIVKSLCIGRGASLDAVAADYDKLALAAFAIWTESLLQLVTP